MTSSNEPIDIPALEAEVGSWQLPLPFDVNWEDLASQLSLRKVINDLPALIAAAKERNELLNCLSDAEVNRVVVRLGEANNYIDTLEAELTSLRAKLEQVEAERDAARAHAVEARLREKAAEDKRIHETDHVRAKIASLGALIHRNKHLEADLAVYRDERDAAVTRAKSAEQDWANREADTMRLGVQLEDAECENSSLRAKLEQAERALTEIEEIGTRHITVCIGDMYDLEGGYDDYETVSDEAVIARDALAAIREKDETT